jgi:hypothetical protein
MIETAAIDSVTTADGTELVLARTDNEWIARAGARMRRLVAVRTPARD